MRVFAIAALLVVLTGIDHADATPRRAGVLEFAVTRSGQPFGVHSGIVSGEGGALLS
jgi:hypothetical protein